MLFHSSQYSNLVYFFFQQQADLSFEVLFIKMVIVASIWNCLLFNLVKTKALSTKIKNIKEEIMSDNRKQQQWQKHQ